MPDFSSVTGDAPSPSITDQARDAFASLKTMFTSENKPEESGMSATTRFEVESQNFISDCRISEKRLDKTIEKLEKDLTEAHSKNQVEMRNAYWASLKETQAKKADVQKKRIEAETALTRIKTASLSVDDMNLRKLKVDAIREQNAHFDVGEMQQAIMEEQKLELEQIERERAMHVMNESLAIVRETAVAARAPATAAEEMPAGLDDFLKNKMVSSIPVADSNKKLEPWQGVMTDYIEKKEKERKRNKGLESALHQ